MSGNSIRDTFFEECEELLEALVEGLSQMEQAPDDMEVVNAVFRSVHSIKGGAGAFALDRLVSFAHSFETVMDKVRDRDLAVDEKLMSLFHRAGDHLSDLVESARDETHLDDEAESGLIGELDSYLGDEAAAEEFSFDAVTLDFDGPAIELPSEDDSSAMRVFDIRFEPSRALYENGHEPLLILDALADLGELTVEADISRIPEFDAFDPADAFLSWHMRLASSEPETTLHEVFEFVEGLCDLDISVTTGPEEGPLTAPLDPEPSTGTEEPIAEIEAAEPQDEDPPYEGPPRERRKEPRGPKPTLRVDLDRVDRLINTVGELIINQAMISQRIEELDLPTVAHLTNELEAYKLLARDIQEGVMAIRAQPVKPLFQRMSRIVREASDATGKKAKMVTVGDSTEVDKTVIERLADPLTHMVRNAVDHGLEKPDGRDSAGKDPVGTIRLSASHRSGSVLIEISDDGAGLNRERILAKAIEKGLVPPDVELSDPEIDNLLFLPGFSTAGEVSALSGRGVGMDVVKNAVHALGGRVSITSTPGKGTTFAIVLPLTLAVMDGFVISVADQTMVIPISSILETIRPNPRDIHVVGTDSQVVSVRGSYVPIVDVADNLGLSRHDDTAGAGILLLVSTELQGLTALRVTAIHDQRQVVIKSLESNYAAIRGVSAATILGDGKIALILDPEELINLAHASGNDPFAQHSRMELRHG
ncbi:two-component system, chemotaxis family, sensor kinase CheA [Mameliella alba]|uniref:chemotaxis protein CheA n=1 Tax=Mameliella alba TaxID=561184 RepID=UPI000880DBBA|nr:chemotaxis protein CheA [Mameliella alba]OWV41626.1 chemotaxis protein CheA [Mameliella alba]PTR34684.1 two-component system chemotaxis sensor kinase CheA [Mameliella alba]GGF83564.1 chemotaxis protein CheA [Mameliella alba]SDE22715.1 two-component system, chemotaxis family, sensor kinase CheA [Mameliella alba]